MRLLLIINYFCIKNILCRNRKAETKKKTVLLSLFFTFSYSFNLRKFRIKQEPDKDKLNFPLLFSFVQCYQIVSSQIGRITGNFTFSGSN